MNKNIAQASKVLFQESRFHSFNKAHYKIFKINSDLILEPKIPQQATLLWMHGLGDSPMGFLDFFLQFVNTAFIVNPYFNRKATKIILPSAPIAPVTINGGYEMPSWYDIKSMDRFQDFSAMEKDAKKNSERLIKMLEEERQFTDNIFVGGFSQGCAMSFYLGSSIPFLKGIIGCSGYVFPFIQEVKIPTFFAHGDNDPMIAMKFAEESCIGKFKNNNLDYHRIKGLGHSVSIEEMKLISNWYKSILETEKSKNSPKESL